MRIKKFLFLGVILLIITTFVGCGGGSSNGPSANTDQPDNIGDGGTAIVTGIITDGRSGPALSNATVQVYTSNGFTGASTTTDGNGNFSISIPSALDVDLIVSKNGYASTRWQRINIPQNTNFSANMVIKKVFNTDWTTTPPKMTIYGMISGGTVSGTVSCTVNLDGGQDPTSATLYWAAGIEDTVYVANPPYPYQLAINSVALPNGSSFYYFVAYDKNNNCVIRRVPVVVNNNGTTGAPLHMTEPVYLTAVNYGDDLQIDQIKSMKPSRLKNSLVNLSTWKKLNQTYSAEPKSACYVYLEWYGEFSNNPQFKRYMVYRASTATGPWVALGYAVYNGSYFAYDRTAAVTPNVVSYYKVTPVNSDGVEGTGSFNYVIPLPRLEVDLVSPANNITGVSLTPIFTWTKTLISNVSYHYDFTVLSLSTPEESYSNSCTYSLTADSTVNSITFSNWSGFSLKNNQMYEWDISNATATLNYSTTSSATSFAVKGYGYGSYNGGFDFTTQ